MNIHTTKYIIKFSENYSAGSASSRWAGTLQRWCGQDYQKFFSKVVARRRADELNDQLRSTPFCAVVLEDAS